MAYPMIVTGPLVLVRVRLTTSWVGPPPVDAHGDRSADQHIMTVWNSTSEGHEDVQLKRANVEAELDGISVAARCDRTR